MSGDYSRQRFSPFDDFSSVLMQQGRVQLDSDWNELAAILDRRLRAGTLDTLGIATVPVQTEDAFLISLASGQPTIGPGRLYIDGILAENHGKRPDSPAPLLGTDFDPVLAEPSMGYPLPFNEQPFFGDFASIPDLPAGGPHLVYLDVWQREVTHLEDPGIVENAVGVDTTTRVQTVWQVRALPNIDAAVTCATPDGQIEGWPQLTAPSAGRLTTSAVAIPDDDDPCLLPPGAGYKGLENRLYRVQIHDGGPLGNATFKWSRDNASVASTVTAIPKANQLVVWSVGKDATLRFSAGDWVEITDDRREFAGQPGIMARINDVDDATRLISLTADLPANTFPISGTGETDPALHSRLYRWDQRGQVTDVNDLLLNDLTDNASGGAIPVPSDGAAVIIEDGVQIAFDLSPAGGEFHPGDYWTFAARTADASVQSLEQAPPAGIHHHYCRLAIVTLPNTVIDCRTIWPPEFSGVDCECTVCIGPEDGPEAIQGAIDEFKEAGATICLGPGVFNLGKSPLVISKGGRLRIKGQPWTTQLVYLGPGSIITLDNTEAVTIEDVVLHWSASPDLSGPAIDARNCIGLTIQRCYIQQVEKLLERRIPAIGLSDHVASAAIRENLIYADIGIANISPAHDVNGPQASSDPWQAGNALLTSNLRIEENQLDCLRRAVSLESATYHSGQTVISSNVVSRCQEGGLVARGSTLKDHSVVAVDANHLEVDGPGIIAGGGRALITRNTIASPGQSLSDGIAIIGAGQKTSSNTRIILNHISGFAGSGIAIDGQVGEVMIKQNVIEHTGTGILMTDKAAANILSIENNQLLDLAWSFAGLKTEPSAIRIVRADKLNLSDNAIEGMIAELPPKGVQMFGPTTSANITGNLIAGINGPEGNETPLHGIEFNGPFDDLHVSGNQLRWTIPDEDFDERWALIVSGETRERRDIIDPNLILFLALEEETFTFHDTVVRRAPFRKGHLTVQGNHFDSDRLARTVNILTRGGCLFANNQCSLTQHDEVLGVEVKALSVIASANYLGGMRMEMVVQQPSTVLGNVTSGIFVNGAALPAPWLPLNVV